MRLRGFLGGMMLLFSFGVVCQAQSISATSTLVPGSCTSSSNAVTASASCSSQALLGSAFAEASAAFGAISGALGYDGLTGYVIPTVGPSAQSSFSDAFKFQPVGKPTNAVVVFFLTAITYGDPLGPQPGTVLTGNIGGITFQGQSANFLERQSYAIPLQFVTPIDIDVSGAGGFPVDYVVWSFNLDYVVVCASNDYVCQNGDLPANPIPYSVYTASGYSYPGIFRNADYVGAAPGLKGPSPLKLSNTSWHFSHHSLGQTSGNGKIYIYNEGPAADTTTGFTLTGENAYDFKIVATTCLPTFFAYHTCSVTFNFTPSGIGARSAILNLNDNSTNGPIQIPIAGDGIPD